MSHDCDDWNDGECSVCARQEAIPNWIDEEVYRPSAATSEAWRVAFYRDEAAHPEPIR